jgi:cell wall assembly regulator SMI1
VLLDTLNTGAQPAEIVSLERAIKRTLPDDVRESLSIHNGQPRQLTGFVFGLDLLDCKRIAQEWERWAGLTSYNPDYRDAMASFPQGAVQLDYANPGWIPLTKDGGGNYLGVDLAPGPAGSTGQVINFGRDEELKAVLAAGWGEFLLSYAKFLESGALAEISPEARSWGDNFEQVMTGHRHDVLVKWRKAGRWLLK